MSYCSRSRRRRFTVLDFKSWAYSLIYGHFQQHLYCACAETVIYEPPVFRHRRSIRRPRFPIRVQNFGDLATFSVDFCILSDAECPPYFYCRFVWPTDLQSIPPASTPTSIIPPSLKPLRRSVLELWVITFPIGYHWKCVRGHCACAESRDP